MIRSIMFFIVVLSFAGCTREVEIKQSIDNIFSEFNNKTPGASVAVVKDKNIIYQRGFGLSDLQLREKIEPKTNFRLASITKQFTLFSILLLEDENKLSFQDSLQKFFPNLPLYSSRMTIKNILQHTSGLLAYEDHMPDTLTVQLKDKDVLQILMDQDSTYFPPGTEHRYSNSGYAVLALIIEKVSGKSFAQFLKDRIISPLDMNSTIAFEKSISTVKNRAYGYTKTDSGFVNSDQSLTSAVLGDGGIYSSTIDLIKWDRAIDSTTLLKSDKLSKMFEKAILPNGEIVDYGLGWRLDPYKGYVRQYHTGGTSGFSNIYMKLPQFNLTIIVLINIKDFDAKNYAEKIADLFIK